MFRTSAIAILASVLLWGCGVTVVPGKIFSGTVNPEDNSIAQQKGPLKITVRVQDLEYAPYRLVNNITTFHVAIRNDGSESLSVPLESFVLVDGKGNQYRPMAPGEVRKIVRRQSAYLIPYPYVGFYYLEDAEKSAFFNTFTSSLPYYAENYPQETFTEALPAGDILPGSRISGLLYFVVDLSTKEKVELRVYLPGTPPSAPADLVFPFSIEK